jgi:hypothetical protein
MIAAAMKIMIIGKEDFIHLLDSGFKSISIKC